jgi:hypothetical protein
MGISLRRSFCVCTLIRASGKRQKLDAAARLPQCAAIRARDAAAMPIRICQSPFIIA